MLLKLGMDEKLHPIVLYEHDNLSMPQKYVEVQLLVKDFPVG